jgi:hypothetical protein
MKKFLVLFSVLFSFAVFAQKKVILISSKYDFQSEKNSYNINNMLKAILTSNNYQVYFDDAVLPMEIAQNRCNALTGVLVDNSNMFSTKLKFQIKDCQNNLLFETAEVKSKEKDMQLGFMEAIKLLSPELKKYKPAVIQKKEDVNLETTVELKTKSNVKYQLIETSSNLFLASDDLKQVINLYATSNPSVFIAKKDAVNGVFTLINKGKGIFEYYLNEKLVVEEYLF